MKSPEWRGIIVASAIAFLSVSLLAADALLDLNAGAVLKRLESAQASLVDTMGHHQLAFAVRSWARGNAPPEQPCQHSAC
ncbi:hypothetical protein JQ594_22020 [Bradyrhizobium manausense]|uniref:hypothetical protein n=1 Tax=Bradyrhizobium manausense TaxID=989370 RepID=UPI001BA4C178|nr:hypothetical protein [Bradyrhizobium manausense]MBR0688618.1 hypothetical protein [Bradyrhizobium manausense]MBR0720743.1 hypothetical protein [Bradyrhizobium manausense]